MIKSKNLEIFFESLKFKAKITTCKYITILLTAHLFFLSLAKPLGFEYSANQTTKNTSPPV